jgi:hypothetical protein
MTTNDYELECYCLRTYVFMKKYIIIASILLLASACSKSQPVVQPASPSASQGGTATSQTPPAASSTPAAQTATSTAQKPPASTAPVTLEVYNNTPEHFKILYLNYFKLFTGAQVKANNTKGVNFSACVPYGEMPSWCFVLNKQPYASTNLESAGMAVSILKNITNIGDCGTFTEQELNGGQVKGAVQGNGVVFITAVATDAGAGNFSETHFNRAFYGNICYEIDETSRWADAENFSPPKAEFNRTDVWNKLDVLRNGFLFVK